MKLRIQISVGILAVAWVASCALIPERFAVNAPLSQLLFDRGAGTPPAGAIHGRMRAAHGLAIGLFAEDLPGARMLRTTSAGDLLVSLPKEGQIRLLERDADGDGRSDGVHILLGELNGPHGMALREEWLYVAERDAIGRIRFDAAERRVTGDFERIVTGLPTGGNHWTRSIDFGPDGGMYLSIGSSCNVCFEEDERRAAMMRFKADGSEAEIYATGLRNAVDFDWRPGTTELYATDNGRDLLGDDFPPCELNRVERGGFYGWPIANGDRVPDPDVGAGMEQQIAASIPPYHPFRAHNAPLGIHFVRGDNAPAAVRGAALVALHGSWNRSAKDGYKVVSLHWQTDGSVLERDFATGFLSDDNVIGRPVDMAEGMDGAIYISDDYAGVVWRVAQDIDSESGALPSAVRRDGAAALAALPARERRDSGARGEALYAENQCAACHEEGEAAQGIVVHSLAGLGDRHDLGSLMNLLETPTPPMPVPPFDAEQRRDVAVFLLEQWQRQTP